MIGRLAIVILLTCYRDTCGEDQLILTTFRPNDFAMLPQYKLLFCRIHKAGSTALTALASSISPPPYPDLPTWTHHQPTDYNLSAADVSRVLRDPSWLKVVIYRDPLARFLSAYRSKCEEFDRDRVCSSVFHERRPSFAGAIRQMILREDFTPDSHFCPQAEICDLQTTLPYFTDRFALDRTSSYARITRILDQAHVEITERVNKTIYRHFAPPGMEHLSPHITHSEETSTLLSYYNHDCFIRLIVHHYQIDYFLFQLPCPDWAMEALERTTLDECMKFIETHRFD